MLTQQPPNVLLGFCLEATYTELEDWSSAVLAYEPLQQRTRFETIHTGERKITQKRTIKLSYTPQEIEDTHKFIRGWLNDGLDEGIGEKIPILYAGFDLQDQK